MTVGFRIPSRAVAKRLSDRFCLFNLPFSQALSSIRDRCDSSFYRPTDPIRTPVVNGVQ